MPRPAKIEYQGAINPMIGGRWERRPYRNGEADGNAEKLVMGHWNFPDAVQAQREWNVSKEYQITADRATAWDPDGDPSPIESRFRRFEFGKSGQKETDGFCNVVFVVKVVAKPLDF